MLGIRQLDEKGFNTLARSTKSSYSKAVTDEDLKVIQSALVEFSTNTEVFPDTIYETDYTTTYETDYTTIYETDYNTTYDGKI